ncbi:MAG: hypothetical protein JO129_02410, partial [Candidatus Dependentiae bacterium]|nr:hypothetical protein [Candidatus Dependentiae bacterium]
MTIETIYWQFFVNRNNYTVKEKNIKAQKNNSNLYELEHIFWQKNQLVCGIDEVGRGCLAGPIVTAAVILSPHAVNEKIKDSKLLNPIQL